MMAFAVGRGGERRYYFEKQEGKKEDEESLRC